MGSDISRLFGLSASECDPMRKWSLNWWAVRASIPPPWKRERAPYRSVRLCPVLRRPIPTGQEGCDSRWVGSEAMPPDTEERNRWDESWAAARPIGSPEYRPSGYRQSESCRRRNMGNLLQPREPGDGGRGWPTPQSLLRIARGTHKSCVARHPLTSLRRRISIVINEQPPRA